MRVMTRRGWEIPESLVTPERFVLGRRSLVAGPAAGLALPRIARAQGVPRNPAFQGGRPITAEQDATTYNNFYEFGTDKSIYRQAQRMPVSPWSIKIDGMVENPRTIGLDDLLKQVRLEERVYRHRCVEAWSMVVPWTGFPMRDLVKMCAPAGSAKYVEMETLQDPKSMPGLRLPVIDWPYREGLTVAEANNELAFIATGMYGKNLPKQDGAPIRLVVPWKYGFKSIKSIVRINFTDKQPLNSWQATQPNEYGFWANVNPAVPHPRWSQATERVLGTDERAPTQIFNGYGDQVASLYAGMSGDKLYR